MALPDLTNEFAADTYKGILHTSNVPVSGANLPPVYDGLGNRSSLSLGSNGNGASISGTLSADGLTIRGYATIVDYIYPVGAVFLDTLDVNPQTRFTGTSWSKISEGKFLAGVGSGIDRNLTAGTIVAGNDLSFGEYTHTLSISSMPAHTHDIPTLIFSEAGDAGTGAAIDTNTVDVTINPGTASTGGGGAHNNIPPYFGVYIWKRLT